MHRVEDNLPDKEKPINSVKKNSWTNQKSNSRYATCLKRGKTCDLRQARENMTLVSSAGKYVSCVKRGKQT